MIKHIFMSRKTLFREDDWKSMARMRLRKFEEELQSAIEGGMNTYSGHTTWSFVNAVIYCLDISTTTGKPDLQTSCRENIAEFFTNVVNILNLKIART